MGRNFWHLALKEISLKNDGGLNSFNGNESKNKIVLIPQKQSTISKREEREREREREIKMS